jgi:hypothetical protein
MRKNFLWMIAATLTCTLAAGSLIACSGDSGDDGGVKPEPQPEAKTEVTMMYYLKVSSDVLQVADVEVNYVDQTGAKKKEALTSAEWKKTFSANALPLTEGLWAKITPKASIAEGSYQLNLTTAAGYEAKLPTGKTIADAFGSSANTTPSTAKTADNVATWCAQSTAIAFTVGAEGYAKTTTVDFGGNSNGCINTSSLMPECYTFSGLFNFSSSNCNEETNNEKAGTLNDYDVNNDRQW